MMKQSLMIVIVFLASTKLSMGVDDHKKEIIFKDGDRWMFQDSYNNDAETNDETSDYNEYITVDPDEPTPEKFVQQASKGPKGTSALDVAPFPLFNWHQKIWMRRVIPYVIKHKGKTRAAILNAMKRIKGNMGTCISFRKKRRTDKSWLEFYYGKGCFSAIGRVYWKRGPTKISLGKNCQFHSVVQHEILHALGFPHEQSRPDRDKYVQIKWNNIRPGMELNFKKSRVTASHYFGTKYDYRSIMHYSRTAFVKKGKGTTMQRIGQPKYKLGGKVMSATDKRELKAMYHCHQKRNGWSRWMSTECMCTEDKSFCSQSKVRICIGTRPCRGGRGEDTQHNSKKCYPKDACEDNPKYEKNCAQWARAGQCNKNKQFMKGNCCRSCRLIKPSKRSCKDNSEYRKQCPQWKKSGECKKNKAWMLKNCCASCG